MKKFLLIFSVFVVKIFASIIQASAQSTLRESAAFGNSQAVLLLLFQGADVNAQSADGLTALYVATSFGHAEIASILLAAGAR